MKPRKIKISQSVKDKRAKYEPSRSEEFDIGRVSNGDLARLTDAHGRLNMATRRLGSPTATWGDAQEHDEASTQKDFVKRSMKPTYSATVKGKPGMASTGN